MFGFSPFGKRGVPRKDLALAALGVEKAKKGLERERKGAKGLDEIHLSAAEMAEAKREERIWSDEQLKEWLGKIWKNPDQIFDRLIDRQADGSIKIRTGALHIPEEAPIDHLPPMLRVNSLNVSKTGITQLPFDLKATSINADYSSLQSLPPGLTAERASFYQTVISDIPPDIHIENLNIESTPIKTIPDHVDVSYILAEQSNLQRLPLGEFEVFDASTTDVSEIPAGFHAKVLLLKNCPIRTLPDGYQGNVLNLDYSGIKSLPDHLNIRLLSLIETDVISIPDTAQIGKLKISKDQTQLADAAKKRGINILYERS